MSNFVMIVHIEVNPDGIEKFIQAARKQAEKSVELESGCRRFDIVRHPENGNRFSHYEIFEDLGAFEVHTKMPHTAEFAKSVESLIVKTEVFRGDLEVSIAK